MKKLKIIVSVLLSLSILFVLSIPAFAEEVDTSIYYGTETSPCISKIDYDGRPTQASLFKSLKSVTEDWKSYSIVPYNNSYFAVPTSLYSSVSSDVGTTSYSSLNSSSVYSYDSSTGVFSRCNNLPSPSDVSKSSVYCGCFQSVGNNSFICTVPFTSQFFAQDTDVSGTTYLRTVTFSLSDISTSDFSTVFSSIKYLIPILMVAIVAFIAFRKGWSFLKGEVRSA